MARKASNRTGGRDTERDPRVGVYVRAQEAAVLEVADQGLLTLASLVQSGSIDVSPTFQRRDRWNSQKQSQLIESFLVNIPVPPVYLAEDVARLGSYAVIDGKQRLTSISTFFEDRLVLRGLTRFEELNGYRYSDLPDGIRPVLRPARGSVAHSRKRRCSASTVGARPPPPPPSPPGYPPG